MDLLCADAGEPTLELIGEGSGGAYLVYIATAAHEPVAVFKPRDEEPGAPKNPKQHYDAGGPPRKLPPGFLPGEGALKEVLAYVVDCGAGHHGAGVPMTVAATIGSRVGALQRFVPHRCLAWELSPSLFDTESVHRIALLDLRLLNADRHGGNLLVVSAKADPDPDSDPGKSPAAHTDDDCEEYFPEYNADNSSGTEAADGGAVTARYASNVSACSSYRRRFRKQERGKSLALVPVDHGLCVPAYPHVGDCWFEWLFWPQAELPLSAASFEYARRVLLRPGLADECSRAAPGLRDACARSIRVAAALLDAGLRARATLRCIGLVASRVRAAAEPSTLERLCAAAEEGGGGEEDFLARLGRLLAREFACK
eukprot:TRINITY_DN12_c0_g3_i1.p1 TRINITY_DN12_c0_g3~~TRINITY_DN12_c0_g3_i1.p1  ORF type:complete len:369 (+),score=84.26 TRINITY_DN12_c0_g3_i1:196-1302(+)